MPKPEKQTWQEIAKVYDDVRKNLIDPEKTNTAADRMVKDFIGDDGFLDHFKSEVTKIQSAKFVGRRALYGLVVLAKKQVLDQKHIPYTLESLADLSHDSDEVKAETKKALAEVIKPAAFEWKPGEHEEDFDRRMLEERRKKFNTQFLKPETDDLVPMFMDFFKEGKDLGTEAFFQHMKPVASLLEGVWDVHNQQFLSGDHMTGFQYEECTDTEAKLQAMFDPFFNKGMQDRTSESIFQVLDEGELQDEVELNNRLRSQYHAEIFNNFGVEKARKNFEPMLEANEKAKPEEKHDISVGFSMEAATDKTAFQSYSVTDYGLLSHLTDEEQIIFALDPEIKANLKYEVRNVDGEKVPSASYKGIDLQMTTLHENVNTAHLADLKESIAAAYDRHVVLTQGIQVDDFSASSMKDLAKGLQIAEDELGRNTHFYNSSRDYREMQSKMKDFRKFAEKMADRGTDLSDTEKIQLQDYLAKANVAVENYLEGKGANQGNKEFKNSYEESRVEAARKMANVLRKTNTSLGQARKMEQFRERSEAGIAFAEKNVFGFTMKPEDKAAMMSRERYDEHVKASQNMRNAGYTARDAWKGSEKMSGLPLDFMTNDQRMELFAQLKDDPKALGLNRDDLKVIENVISSYVQKPEKQETVKTVNVNEEAWKGTLEQPKTEKAGYGKLLQDINNKIEACGPEEKGYKAFLQEVRTAQTNLYTHLSINQQYSGYKKDMKTMMLYEESKRTNDPRATHTKEEINIVLGAGGDTKSIFQSYRDNINFGKPFDELMKNTTPTKNKQGETVTNKANAMKAMRSFLYGDGAKVAYEQKFNVQKAEANHAETKLRRAREKGM